MTRFDPETIAALAEGRLEAADAAELERELGADPEAAAELAAQRKALEALGRLPAASLRDDERTRLRSSVADALGLAPAPAPAPQPPRRRIPWPTVAVAAASLVAIVAIVPATGLLSTGGDDGDTQATAVAGEAPEAELREEAFEAPDAFPGDDEAGDRAAAAGEAEDGTLATTTTAAAADLQALPPGVDPALAALLEDPDALAANADGSLTRCRSEAVELIGEDDGAELIATPVVLADGSEAVVWSLPSEPLRAVAFATEDCAVLVVTD
jgi:hypothetical protein